MIHNSKSKTYHSNQQRERHWKHTFLVLTGMGKWEERLGRDSAPVDSSAAAGASPQRTQRKQHLLNCSPPPAPLSSWRFPIVLYKQCLRKGWSRLFSTKAQWGSITHPPPLFLGGGNRLGQNKKFSWVLTRQMCHMHGTTSYMMWNKQWKYLLRISITSSNTYKSKLAGFN